MVGKGIIQGKPKQYEQNVNIIGYIDTKKQLFSVTNLTSGKSHTWIATENSWVFVYYSVKTNPSEGEINFSLKIDGVTVASKYSYVSAESYDKMSYEDQMPLIQIPVKKGQEVIISVVKTTNSRSCSLKAYGMC